MKKYINKLINFWILGIVTLMAVSCDLGLQQEWEYVREPIGNKQTGLTAYEWMQEINQDPYFNDADSLPEFSYMLDAIALTGLQEEFNDPNDSRTFFLLRNTAWKNNGQILTHMAGNNTYPLDSIENNVVRLTNLLHYHIIDEPLDQGTSIPKWDFHFYYETLIPGDTGIMEINKRLFDATIRINSSIARIGSPSTPSNMPSSAKGGTVALHNYQFTNGVGHQMNGYLRYQPF